MKRRPPERIKRVLGLLGEIWSLHPDLRLGQLLVNVVRQPGQLRFLSQHLFYLEDSALEDLLLKFHESTKNER